MRQKTYTAAEGTSFTIQVEENTGSIGGLSDNPYSGSATHTVTAVVPGYDDFVKEGITGAELGPQIGALVDDIKARLENEQTVEAYLTGAGFAVPLTPGDP